MTKSKNDLFEKSSPASLLALAQQEFEADQAKLKEAFEKKTKALLDGVKIELAESLGAALSLFDSLPVDVRKTVLVEPGIETILTGLGLQPKSEKIVKTPSAAKGGTKTPRADLNETAVIAICGTNGIAKGQLINHFAGGAAIVTAFLDKMIKEDKLKTEVRKGKGAPATIYLVK